MDKIENEIKLGKNNLQLKYQSNESNESIKKKIIFLCKILDIELRDQKELEISDRYFDNKQFDLFNKNITLRRRETREKKQFTIKKQINVKGNEFSRNEISLNFDLENEGEILKKILNDFLPELDTVAKKGINKKVLVSNDRLKFYLNSDGVEGVLCFDKYYFYLDADYSEYYYQVELEFNGPNTDIKGTKFEKLINCVEVLFDFKPETSSKYKQALAWTKNKTPQTHDVSVIMLDIVGYSTKDNLIQKNIIQHLNKIVKGVLNENYAIFSNEKEVIYIPTGDGMIVVLFDKPEKLPMVCASIQKKLREYNSNILEEDLKYNIRIGLNYGPVFIYSDIKENLNFAGNGINMVQRITNFGDEGHILFSKETYDLLSDRSNFHYQGMQIGKHGVDIEVYSYYSKEYKFGNPDHI